MEDTRYKIYGRAETPGQKEAVLKRIYYAWLANPQLRLGQLISNSVHSELKGKLEAVSKEDIETRTFFIEDEKLAQAMEQFKAG